MSTLPVWFITGCSTGFGRELATEVLTRGWRVVATARNPDQLRDLAAGHEDSCLPFPLDVTDQAQISAAVTAAEKRFGAIDVLVNNAGYGYLAAVEEGDDAGIRAQFETNFFGLAALVRAVLPGMRRRRNGAIVAISSVGGMAGFPGVGYYNASKFAVEGLMEALAQEVAPLGIRVLLVEPGPFRTDWAGRSLQVAATEIADYAATAGARRQRISAASGRQPGDPVRAARAIIAAVTAPQPPLRMLLGRFALDTVRAKLASLKAGIDAWEAVTLGADFPEE
jgi:NAD(P)-dependent dehydrogenase (short-subunit alcohol dehydrogenase family)